MANTQREKMVKSPESISPRKTSGYILLIGFLLSCANYTVFIVSPQQADFLVGELYANLGLTDWPWFQKQVQYAHRTVGFTAFLLLIYLQFVGAIVLLLFMMIRRVTALVFPSLGVTTEKLRIFRLLVTSVILGSYLGPLNADILQDTDPRISSMPTNMTVFGIAVGWWVILFMAKMNALEPDLANSTLKNDWEGDGLENSGDPIAATVEQAFKDLSKIDPESPGFLPVVTASTHDAMDTMITAINNECPTSAITPQQLAEDWLRINLLLRRHLKSMKVFMRLQTEKISTSR